MVKILKIYSLLVMVSTAASYLQYAFILMPLRHLVLLLLTMPVIYVLTQDLFSKNKPANSRGLKIYAFTYVCCYMLWWLGDMVGYLLYGAPSDYFRYAAGCIALLILAPIMYSFAKDIFVQSKAPRNIFITTIFFIGILMFVF